MSDDIVERLDKRADALRRYYPGMHWTIKDVEAAADEIERLRTAEFVGRLPDYVKELEAEIERLLGVLRKWGIYGEDQTDE